MVLGYLQVLNMRYVETFYSINYPGIPLVVNAVFLYIDPGVGKLLVYGLKSNVTSGICDDTIFSHA